MVLSANLAGQDKFTARVTFQDDAAFLSITGCLQQYIFRAGSSVAEWHAHDIPPRRIVLWARSVGLLEETTCVQNMRSRARILFLSTNVLSAVREHRDGGRTSARPHRRPDGFTPILGAMKRSINRTGDHWRSAQPVSTFLERQH